MARLRIRIELSRGGLGVPLHKVASVVSKSQKFLDMLGEDVHIDGSKGEWLGFDFDRESLNFTAEYVGAVTTQQVHAFNAAFDGTTSLRRETIAQFASITDAIGEDEIIGFGLYQTDEVDEPTEWRCLSRRDALRIAEGIQLLLEGNQESHLPAARDPDLGARIFGERREWGVEQRQSPDFLREVEKTLSARIERVENQMDRHSELIQNLHAHSVSTETSVRNLLTTVESFCNQATRRIEMATPIILPISAAEPEPPPQPAQPPTEPQRSPRRWIAVGTAGIGVAIVAAVIWLPQPRPTAYAKNEPPVIKTQATPSPKPEPTPVAESKPLPIQAAAPTTPATPTGLVHLELEATAPTWVSIVDSEGNRLLSQLLSPDTGRRTLELTKDATLLTGNAGGLILRVNGEQLSSLGSNGQVRQIQFKDGKALPSSK